MTATERERNLGIPAGRRRRSRRDMATRDPHVLSHPLENIGSQPSHAAATKLEPSRKPADNHQTHQQPSRPAREPRDIVRA
jgi:hypothetical protein